MFEKATRLKLRFQFKGQCSVEDLWDSPIQDLNNIYCELEEIKQKKQKGLLAVKSRDDEAVELRLAIIKHIVITRLEEQQTYENTIVKAEKKQKILSIIAEKQNEQYKDMTVEDLNKLIKDL